MLSLALPIVAALLLLLPTAHAQFSDGSKLSRVKYNHPGLVTDLGVGLWAQPLPVDFDGDGDVDLLCATADVPYKGIYLFENPGGDSQWPVFKPAKRLDTAMHNITISYVDDEWIVATPGQVYPDFAKTFFKNPTPIAYEPTFRATRAKQWKFVDYDGDGALDLIVGASDWTEYGWDDAYNDEGVWQQGPLRGHIYVMRNTGTNAAPNYAEAMQVQAGGKPLDVYGCPSPNFVDMDADGDLDILTGEFMDRVTYFENTGSRTKPEYAAGRFLTYEGKIIHQDLQMLQVVIYDWNGDSNPDVIVGKEDGRVVVMLNTGEFANGVPQFTYPRYLKQQADNLKIGALCTPVSVDWDGDGDEDIISGDTAGYINFVENLDGGNPPRWAAPVYLEVGGDTFRVLAGSNGSIQGPAEAKWGYTTLDVGDLDADGDNDIIFNSIWGKVQWLENVGEKGATRFDSVQAVLVPGGSPDRKPAWNWWSPVGDELVTQWRTTPVLHDLNADGLNDLVMLDQEGYLVFYERTRDGDSLSFRPAARIFKNEEGSALRLNEREAGKSGRRKIALTDWDRDGKLDILINSANIEFLKNVGDDGDDYRFKSQGDVDPHKLAGHTTSPTLVEWDKNGVPDLLIGAEDGFLYHLENPHQP